MATNTAIQAFQPKNLAEAWEMSRALSDGNLLGQAYQKNPSNILATIMHGAALGMNPAQALVAVHVIEGKPTLAADAMRAVCVSNADICEYFRCVETTPERATFVTKRKGDPEVQLSFTMDDARKAGLSGRGNWNKYPSAMLRARAGSGLARLVFPDLLLGVYDPDELAQDVRGPQPVIVSSAPEPVATREEEPVEDPEAIARADAFIARISRIKNAFEMRAWAKKHGPEVRALPKSQFVRVDRAAAEHDKLLAAAAAAEKEAERAAAHEHYDPPPTGGGEPCDPNDTTATPFDEPPAPIGDGYDGRDWSKEE